MRTIFILCLILPLFPRLWAQNFSIEEQNRILRGDTALMMPVVQVTLPVEYQILKTPSMDISPDDVLLPLLAKRMYMAMRDTANPGIGIAAPQVGINRNAIWVQRFDKENEPFEFYLNPRITWHSELMRKGKEGCLSIPEVTGNVMRYYTIRLAYQDTSGKSHEEMVEGFTAVVFQHETDHIKGILFTDRLKEQESGVYFQINDKTDLFVKKLQRR